MVESYMLNDVQKICVEAKEGPFLILSGAGTGKTTVLVERFKELVNNGVNPRRILCVTFTNKAAAEMVERINENVGLDGNLWIGTFHKISIRLMQISNLIDKNTIIIDELDQKKIFAELDMLEKGIKINYLRDNMCLNDELDIYSAYLKYKEYLEKCNYLDFGTILYKLMECAEKDAVFAQEIAERFDYIMVDEFQDTSKLQYEWLKLFLKKHSNLFCVGDEDQCIYSWRGANIGNILNFNKVHKGAQIFKLEANYRCTHQIVSVANSVIKKNRQRYGKELYALKDGALVNLVITKNEPLFIARTLRNSDHKSVGILVRTAAQVRPIEEELDRHGVKYKIYGGTRFFDKAEIKTLICYLRVIQSDDILAFERVVKYPSRRIGEKTFEKMHALLREGLSIPEVLGTYKQEEFANYIRQWRQYNTDIKESGLSLRNLVFRVVSESGMEISQDNLDKFMEKVEGYKEISTFLQDYISIEDDTNATPVTIMTIHASKGLEFDCVFIPGLIKGTFPNFRAEKEGNMEEERRLAYVAITRAKKDLYMTYSTSSGQPCSVFLEDLPDNSIKPIRYMF
jgi:DNA helicase-2/ATP-dependent DNA helicase PcrA